MERGRLLDLMDRNMVAMYAVDTRATPGGVVVERPGLVACRTPRGTVGSNMTIVAGPTTVEDIRALTETLYEGGTYPFSVWTRTHADAGLEAALRAAGWIEVYLEPGMAFVPGAADPAPVPRGVEVRPVADDGDRAAYADVVAAAFGVYGLPAESIREHFADLASLRTRDVQGFLVHDRRGRAVAGATLYMAHGVGGVGWVGARPDAFGRGYGRAATWAVVREGLRRGAAFLSLQASQMGAPMYARMGFTTPTHYRWFVPPG
jgi:hypothetical protein